MLKMTKVHLIGLLLLLLAFPMSSFSTESSGAAVMAPFKSVETNVQEESELNQGRHEILFIMGIILLVFIFATSAFGLALGIYGKNVFVPHMIFAGVSVFLTVAHAVTAVVWFYPY